MNQAPTTLPRRARTISAVSAQLADRKLREVNARQGISDRIGYIAAMAFGAWAFSWGGWPTVGAFALCYSLTAIIAYRRWRDMVKRNGA